MRSTALHVFDIEVYPENIKFIKNLTKVEHLIIPEMGKFFGEKTKVFWKDFLSINNNYEKYISDCFPKKVFVSRRAFKKVGRLAGMDCVAYNLAKIGFIEFRPEKYSLKRQLEVIHNAQEIFWEEGSSIH